MNLNYYVTAFSAQYLFCNFGAIEGPSGCDFLCETSVFSLSLCLLYGGFL